MNEMLYIGLSCLTIAAGSTNPEASPPPAYPTSPYESRASSCDQDHQSVSNPDRKENPQPKPLP